MTENGKKVVILSAIPKRNGFTAEMQRLIEESAPSDVSFDSINLFEAEIKPCTDCGFCHKKDGCSIVNDDFEAITERVDSADIVILLSPVYFLSFPSPLKAYVDRLQRFFSARFIRNSVGKDRFFKNPKKGAVAVCCGAPYKTAVDVIERAGKMVFDCMNADYSAVWSVIGTDSMKIEELSSDENMNKLEKFWEDLK